MERYDERERDDVLLFESPTGMTKVYEQAPVIRPPAVAADPSLVLYVVSLFGVHNRQGEPIDGDALVVRAANQPDRTVLAAVLDCADGELQPLLDRGGAWSVRQISAIDGYRLRFEAN